MTDLTPPVRAHMTRLAPLWREWQQRLPEVLEQCRARWDLELGAPVARRVTSSLHRVQVRGREAVLKVTLPSPQLEREAAILRSAGGQGYVHLFDAAPDLGALLLEPLGRSLRDKTEAEIGRLPGALALTQFDTQHWIATLVEALKTAWQVDYGCFRVPEDADYKATEVHRLITRLATELHQLDQHGAAIERALLYAEHRQAARSASLSVVCHGDAHPGNLLAVESPRPGAPGGYVWVDPDPVLCEPEYDLGVTVRGMNRLLLASDDPVVLLRSWCAQLADATDTDAEAVWQWAFIERVASGLYLIDQGWPERGRPFLEASTWLISRKRG